LTFQASDFPRLFLLGAFARRTRKVQALVATLFGIVVVFWIVFGQTLTFGRQLIHLNLSIVSGTVTLVLAGVLLCTSGTKGKLYKQ
jgi:NADH:ubiquinone oxidoreductase subunit 2 (subunit N)